MPSTDEVKQDAFVHAFHGLPNEMERESMSVLRLAELLAGVERDSTAYIVLSHELNLKIAKLQSKATLSAGRLGAGATIVSSLVTFALGYFIGTSLPRDSKPISASAVSLAPASAAALTDSPSVPVPVPAPIPAPREAQGSASTPAHSNQASNAEPRQ